MPGQIVDLTCLPLRTVFDSKGQFLDHLLIFPSIQAADPLFFPQLILPSLLVFVRVGTFVQVIRLGKVPPPMLVSIHRHRAHQILAFPLAWDKVLHPFLQLLLMWVISFLPRVLCVGKFCVFLGGGDPLRKYVSGVEVDFLGVVVQWLAITMTDIVAV